MTESPRGSPSQDDAAAGKGSGALSVVLVPTLACNCACSHCFEVRDGRRIRAEDWRPIFEAIADVAVRASRPQVRLYWQGGEVLCLAPEDVARGLDVASEVAASRGLGFQHRLQTNLLLYDRARWRDVLRRFGAARLSSSLDHPNLYRRAAGRDGSSYEEAFLARMRSAEEDGFDVSVIALPNAATLELGAVDFYRHYERVVRPAGLQVNLPFRARGSEPPDLDLERLGDFLCALYDVWTESGRTLALSPFEGLERRLRGERASLPCIWSANCARDLLAVGPGGEAAQCDSWLTGDPALRFGSLLRDGADAVLGSPARRRFLQRPWTLLRRTACGGCEFWGLCHGGCPVRAHAATGDLDAVDPYCPVYRRLFRHVAESDRRQPHGGPRRDGVPRAVPRRDESFGPRKEVTRECPTKGRNVRRTTFGRDGTC